MTSVSVVICAHTDKRWQYLVETIGSMFEQTVRPHQVILCIDHNDALLKRALDEFPGVLVVANQRERGLSGGRNTGVSLATGEIVAFIDDDAAADREWIARLIDGYADLNVVSVGGSIEPAWEAQRPRWFPAEFNWVVGCTYTGMPTSDAFVRNVIGCNMSFRASAFKYGGEFKLGRSGGAVDGNHEDTYYCINLTRAIPGSKVLYRPSARVNHYVPASRGTWRYFVKRCWGEGFSKAKLSKIVGNDKSLSNEKSYVAKTLPLGVLRGLADVVKLDISGLGRATAIVAGLVITTAGYARGLIAVATQPGPPQGGQPRTAAG
jgi:glycosyltransferase involved in cell wall biosynthesis